MSTPKTQPTSNKTAPPNRAQKTRDLVKKRKYLYTKNRRAKADLKKLNGTVQKDLQVARCNIVAAQARCAPAGGRRRFDNVSVGQVSGAGAEHAAAGRPAAGWSQGNWWR